MKYIETMSEETKTENTKGNGDLAVVSTRFLPFDSISDLIRKVENIKKAHKIKSETFRQTLKEKGIKFTSIDDYGVVIDIGLLSDEDMRFIKNQDDSFEAAADEAVEGLRRQLEKHKEKNS